MHTIYYYKGNYFININSINMLRFKKKLQTAFKKCSIFTNGNNMNQKVKTKRPVKKNTEGIKTKERIEMVTAAGKNTRHQKKKNCFTLLKKNMRQDLKTINRV